MTRDHLIYLGLFVLLLALLGFGFWRDRRDRARAAPAGADAGHGAVAVSPRGRRSRVTIEARGPARRLGAAGPAHLTVRGFRPGIDRLELAYIGSDEPAQTGRTVTGQGLEVQFSDGSEIVFAGIGELPGDAIHLRRER